MIKVDLTVCCISINFILVSKRVLSSSFSNADANVSCSLKCYEIILSAYCYFCQIGEKKESRLLLLLL